VMKEIPDPESRPDVSPEQTPDGISNRFEGLVEVAKAQELHRMDAGVQSDRDGSGFAVPDRSDWRI
jgi:hypothetical protein